MVQEVQTPMIIPPLTTLEVIEGVGTSSEKIRYGRQTTYRTISYCTTHITTANIYVPAWATVTTEGLFGNLVNYGAVNYAIGTNYLRFPTEGTYEITVTPFTGSSKLQVTTIVLVEGKQVYSYLSNDMKDRVDTFKLDVGKYSRLTVQIKVYRNDPGPTGGVFYCDIGATQL